MIRVVKLCVMSSSGELFSKLFKRRFRFLIDAIYIAMSHDYDSLKEHATQLLFMRQVYELRTTERAYRNGYSITDIRCNVLILTS